MEKQRDLYVDVAKGIAMLLVVRIHSEVFGVLHAPYPIIAVPFFFFLSGFYDNTERPLKVWLPKAFKRLFLVGIIWMLISFLYISFLHYLKDRTIPINFSWQSPLIGGGVVWFLFALFYAKCGTWLIGKTKFPSYVIMTLFVLLGGAMSRYDLPLLLDEGIAAIPFYYFGKIAYPFINKQWKIVKWLAFIGVVCILLMQMPFFPYVLVPYASRPILLYPCYFVMTICSFMTLLFISKKLERQGWLSNFGAQSLGILVLHPLMLYTCVVIANRIMEYGSISWIAVLLVCYGIVCILCYYLSKWISRHVPILFGL